MLYFVLLGRTNIYGTLFYKTTSSTEIWGQFIFRVLIFLFGWKASTNPSYVVSPLINFPVISQQKERIFLTIFWDTSDDSSCWADWRCSCEAVRLIFILDSPSVDSRFGVALMFLFHLKCCQVLGLWIFFLPTSEAWNVLAMPRKRQMTSLRPFISSFLSWCPKLLVA